VYALLAPTFFEMDDTIEERENFVVEDNDNTKTMTYIQQLVETECKSPCQNLHSNMCLKMTIFYFSLNSQSFF
jgi:hypothetical protein